MQAICYNTATPAEPRMTVADSGRTHHKHSNHGKHKHTSTRLGAGDALFARNWLFIPAELQARLAHTTVLTAGTGLGSVVAMLAARTGFGRFILADGDRVEESNLNRQAFSRAHLGLNKAKATAKLVRGVLPDAHINVLPRFLDARDFPRLTRKADVVINTIDLDNPAFLDLNRVARAVGTTVLFPINLGWGGALIVFTPQALSLDEFIGRGNAPDVPALVETQLVQRILERLPGGIPPYMRALLPRFDGRRAESWPYDPQLGVAAHMTAALAVSAAVALAAGQPVRAAPEIIWSDAHVALLPSDADSASPAVTAAIAPGAARSGYHKSLKEHNHQKEMRA